ncbi:MAG: BON domain-containing protein [Bacteriovoracaceae bacterium]
MFHFFEKKDSQLQEDVISELKWDPSVTSMQISVAAKDGVVTLRGNVPHYFDKMSAEQAAQRVSGVRAVADEIEVKMMGNYERSDEDIAKAALNALEWSYAVPKNLKVTVEKGWVSLRGEVEWDYQRKGARDCVKNLMGVSGVTNGITLKTQSQSSDIKKSIEEALDRLSQSENEKINVSVHGDQVVLSGKVHSFSDLSDASYAAWSAPGVMRVENNLRISHS